MKADIQVSRLPHERIDTQLGSAKLSQIVTIYEGTVRVAIGLKNT
jgi:hypothetical protein